MALKGKHLAGRQVPFYDTWNMGAMAEALVATLYP